MKTFEIAGLILCAAAVAVLAGLLVNKEQRENLKSAWRIFFATPEYVRWLGKIIGHAAFTGSLLLVWRGHHQGSRFTMVAAGIWLVLLLAARLRLSRKAAQLQIRQARPALAKESA